MEKPKQARVAQIRPGPLSVEVGEGDEELGHGVALPGKEFGQAIGEGACSAHTFSIASGHDIACEGKTNKHVGHSATLQQVPGNAPMI